MGHTMSTLPPLLHASDVHGRRQVGVWLALAFAAGAVNAAALAACQRFVTHVTGTITRIGADFGDVVLMLDYACVVLFFVAGAMTSVVLIDGRRMRGRAAWPVAPLVLVALILAAVAIAGQAGVFGPFGVGVETPGDFALLCVLACAMGLQNASVATTTGMIVRTTHMTGPVTDFSIALATSLSPGPEPMIVAARRSMALRASKILAFLVGCLVASWLASHLEYALFHVPALAVGIAAAMLAFTLRGPGPHRDTGFPPGAHLARSA